MQTTGYEPVVDTIRDLVRAAAGGLVLVGVGGPVCVGKTTVSDRLRELLAPMAVEVVTTDGFLLSSAELDARGLTMRKGFPESYDESAIRTFLAAVHTGSHGVLVPRYSHELYDVVPGDPFELADAAVVIVEGVNVLRFHDVLDVSVYVDAAEPVIEAWYTERFLGLCAVATPGTFYANFAAVDDVGRREIARHVWNTVNRVNLESFIEPTRVNASIVIEKAADHSVARVLFGDAFP
ncbi:MAG: type I pantothenate kinase [Acidimicrobiia bacterium]|nr:type I pantothenate kinase [Acidimicrobiia bacterium]